MQHKIAGEIVGTNVRQHRQEVPGTAVEEHQHEPPITLRPDQLQRLL